MNIIEAIKNPGAHRLITCKLFEKDWWIEVPVMHKTLVIKKYGIVYVPRTNELLSDEWEVME